MFAAKYVFARVLPRTGSLLRGWYCEGVPTGADSRYLVRKTSACCYVEQRTLTTSVPSVAQPLALRLGVP